MSNNVNLKNKAPDGYVPHDDEYYMQKHVERVREYYRKRKLREQRLLGAGMIALNLVAPTGAIFFLLPLGVWMMVSKEILIY